MDEQNHNLNMGQNGQQQFDQNYNSAMQPQQQFNQNYNSTMQPQQQFNQNYSSAMQSQQQIDQNYNNQTQQSQFQQTQNVGVNSTNPFNQNAQYNVLNNIGDMEIASSRKITQELIGGWFLFGIILGITYNLIMGFIVNIIDSLVVNGIIELVLQAVIIFLIWKLSISLTFKKRRILYEDVPKVIKNLIIFAIVVCIIGAFYQFIELNNKIDETKKEIENSFFYSDYLEDYNNQMAKETRKKLNTYLIIVETGILIINLGILPLEKKEILKYAVDTNNPQQPINTGIF